ncbi:hypothetical protein I0636_001088 [Staphylococcus pseudintermedius]|uniref:YopX family protein n=1 Tax=Staphylococcus pseudintermedius TaxID=283734 RepID=UPI001A0D2FB7|nr:YopX family protein [Staphylococcus pseudintermedius]EGQ1303558.1 hypothetical protein [Staphylococcus pseudintermedius]EGQ1620245.1 hypothetical protein [Staphylococcus pseudintermedius]EGQ1647781.1 hypothetical protein [Staphylococcus pseudintermedius]EGQ2740504.1 hypothetical protein [Staphylococcus pseudintermedius]EGQ2949558.1 hypothetical protein [Staphylococcus pseudintermedius]
MILKFRAWDKTENVMSGVLRISFDHKYVELEKGVFRIFDEVALMQSTGLHDRNSKEIYKGDIVKAYHEWFGKDRTGVIEYDVIDFVIRWSETEQSPLKYWVDEDTEEDKDFEIIGNIYENPDLLQEER